jgi:hypothetical protein
LSAANVSQTGAYLLSNSTTANANLYNIRYHNGSTTTWTVLEHVTLPYQLGNLTCGSVYEWQAQLICPNSATNTNTVSDWSTGITFTTLACTPPSTCNAPTGLSATNVSQTGATLYLTPTSSNTGLFNIRYHNGTTWTVLEHVTLPYQLGNLTCGTVYEWQAQLVCPNTATLVSDWSVGGTFTTLACTPPPTCNAPTGLSATNVSQTGATLYLTPTSSNTGLFNIRYHNGTTTTWTVLEHVTLPYQLGNLTCGTVYEWQAQLICPNSATNTNTVSPWSTAGVFTTLACTPPTCNAPTGLSATNVSQTGATLYLNPTSSNTGLFNIRYHNGTTTTWTVLEHVTLPYQLGNLTCGSAYEWQAQMICPNSATNTNTVSDWSTGITFTTLACTPPPTCNAPTGLSATNVSQTGATLYLNPTSSNTGLFNIRYHNGTTTTWTVLEHVTLPYQLGNLTCGTVYEWQAQLICPNSATNTNTVSPWSTAGVFTTLACTPPPTCNAPVDLTVNAIYQTGATLHWNAVSGAVSYIVYYKKANTFIAYTTATTTTNMIAISGLSGGTAYIWQVQAVCSNGDSNTVVNSAMSTTGVFLTTGVIVYPNPANQWINVSYWVDSATTTLIVLRNSYGQVVYSIRKVNVKGTNELTINASGLSDGLYFLTLESNGAITTSKVLVKH